MWVWVFLVVSILLGAFGQICMKVAMRAVGPVPFQDGFAAVFLYALKAGFSLPMIAAATFYGVSFVLWLAVLSKADLSLARPLMSLGYLVTLVYGFYAGETMTVSRVAGTFLIVGGVMLLVRGGQ